MSNKTQGPSNPKKKLWNRDWMDVNSVGIKLGHYFQLGE
jgi:hypothetical protein